MQDSIERIEAAGGRAVAISADTRDAQDSLTRRFGLTFPLVSDPELKIAASYGVRQEGPDIALPSTFVVDRSGVIRFVKVAENPLDRPAADEIIAVLERISDR